MISTIDILICMAYIVGIVTIGLWYGAWKRNKVSGANSNDYFLAGKSIKWPMVGLSLFATNISCVHLVSLAQSGFDTGLLNGNFEWMAAFTLILLALFFAPFYLKSGVSTLPDFLEKRYNRACRDWLTIISVFSAVIIHIAFSLLAGGIVLETLFGINMYISVSVIAVLTAVYTIVGGLRAVVVTESIQTIVLVCGAILITGACWLKIGGWAPMMEVLTQHHQLNKLSMLRPAGDSSGMPWYAVFLGYPVLGVWYWCADQTIVQRVLGAKDENHARVGTLFCGFLKVLPVFIFVLPGLLAYALVQKGLLDIHTLNGVDAQGKHVVNSKGIYTLMITQLLPTGLVGLLVAALLSGLMSQISGALNSISTLISFDMYKRFAASTTDRQLVRVGRISAGVALVLSIGLLPLLNRYESIFNGLNDIIAHIAPPITCVFLLGVFWGKASATAAKLTLWLGSLLGVVVFALGKFYPDSALGHLPFMMTAFYLFCFCLFLQVSLSYVYPVKHTAQSQVLYWHSAWEPLENKGWPGIGNYKLLSALLVLTMAVLFWIFR
ncbi:sodium:solute symporter [Mucilaginibacter paludis]|uniref:SSS sodium solute transporter superfamily n=1 Tax=Mucilaginibacter paludis DSM 18603 TaxID=714943 RepID=H1Y953_9SPHI|nr:sodium:solute symporter [Mucilaginibacter paludis]EHQ29091.1 SSS sodium solute transporter superfamily [Mucilaginibacter paludis DSM 18603]